MALGGSFAASLLSNLGAVSFSAGQIEILGTANNTGGTLTLGTGSPLGLLGPLGLAGTILNGVVLDAGGGLSFASGTGVLDGVTYVGTLALSGARAAVTLTDAARVTGAGGSAGSIVDTGAGASLLLRGTEMLDYATVQLGSSTGTASISTTDTWLASSGTTATLGAHLTVQQAGLYAAFQANGWSPVAGLGASDTLVNQGVISGAIAGGRLSISGYGTFINQGAIVISGGDTLAVTVGQFANTGTISVASGATMLLGQAANLFGTTPAWSNAGSIAVSGGTLVLAGTMSTSQLGTISEISGSVQLAGTLSNAGATLTLGGHAGALTLSALSLSGTVLGGTISDAAGLLRASTSGSALLDGVSYIGTLALTQAGSFLRIRDGVALNGVVDVLGAGSELGFQGSQAIDHAQILLGSAGSAASIGLVHDPASSGANILTFGGGLLITQAGQLASIGSPGGVAGDMIVNAGTITAAAAGGTMTIGGQGFVNQGLINVGFGDTLAILSPNFSNTGSIAVTGGALSLTGSVTLAGLGQVSLSGGVMTVSGTLDLGGGTLAIGQASAIGRIGLTGTLRNGTIIDAGGGLACSAGATLDGITYAGTLDLSRPFAQLSVAHGLTLLPQPGAQQGSILLTGGQSRIVASTSETLDNAAVSLGSVAQYYAGQRIAPPELDAAAGVQLTLGAGAALTLAGTAGVLGNSALGQWSDSIVNAGSILAATSLGTLSIGSSFFTNIGSIGAVSAANIVFDDTAILNSGVVSIGFGSAVQVLLYDYYAAPNSGTSAFTNTGTIAMQGGILQEPTANGLFPAVPIANLSGGSIQGYGLVFAGIANAGTVEARGGTLLLTQEVMGGGALQVDAGATLELAAPEPAGQIVQFAGSGGTLKLDNPSTFAGTLSGYGAGDVIDLPSAILIGVGNSSGTLVASTATQNFRFASSTLLGGEFSAGHDAHGGATIMFTQQTPGLGALPALIGVGQPGMLFWASPAGDVFQGSSANVAGAHISNWSGADSLDITDMAPATASLTAVQTPNLAVLTISDGTHTSSVGLTGSFTTGAFHLSSDGHGGTVLTYGH